MTFSCVEKFVAICEISNNIVFNERMFVRQITVRFFALNKLMVVYLESLRCCREFFVKKNFFIQGKIFDLVFVELFH